MKTMETLVDEHINKGLKEKPPHSHAIDQDTGGVGESHVYPCIMFKYTIHDVNVIIF